MKTIQTLGFFFCLLISFSIAPAAAAEPCTPVSTAAGTLDSCFGTGGKVTTQLTGGLDWARGVVVQPDGKIVVVGSADQSSGPPSIGDFGVVRYLPDGTLDASFDGDGKVITDFDGGFDSATGVVLQQDGKIVVAGVSSGKFAVARYHPNGLLDETFGKKGRITTDVGAGPLFIYQSLAIQPDGKLIGAGGGDNYGWHPGASLNVVRYNQDGSLDSTFDGDGRAVISAIEYGNGVAIQPDGKILTAGSGNSKLLVARLNADGSPDTAFGANGIAAYFEGSLHYEAFTLALRPNGKIVAAGYEKESRTGRPCGLLVEFNASGAFESRFRTCSGTFPNAINGLFIQPDGKLLTAGFNDFEIWRGFQISRLLGISSYDAAFNNGGVLQIDFDANTDRLSTAYALAMQRDNKIIAVGLLNNAEARMGKFAVVRTMSGLAAPRRAAFDFDGDGRADVGVFRAAGASGNAEWWYRRSRDEQTVALPFGLSSDRAVPADFTGDGRTDLAFFRPASGEWFVLRSEDNSFYAFPFGAGGDVPVAADFDGDGRADPGVFRPSEAVWYVQKSTGGTLIQPFGAAGDKPLAADYDGDSRADFAVFRAAGGSAEWWYQRSSDSQTIALPFGASTDRAVPADYTGDGRADVAFWRPSTGEWFILRSEDNSFSAFPFGAAGDVPVPADYDGDGRSDPAVFRPSESVWYVQNSSSGTSITAFGAAGDAPLPGVFLP